jgi:hypothetical protein
MRNGITEITMTKRTQQICQMIRYSIGANRRYMLLKNLL